MGRAKLPIKLINPERSRNATFTKRRKGLKKKIFEFSTLCDVDACLIIYRSGPSSTPETWPEDPAEVRRIIDRFEKAPVEERDKRMHDISSFLRSKNKKLQDELDQKRRENAELASTLLWNPSASDGMNRDAIRELCFRLTSKINAINQRIETLEKDDHGQQYQNDQLEPGHESTSRCLQCLRGIERRRQAENVIPLQSIAPTSITISPLTQGLHESHGINSFAFNNEDYSIHEVGTCSAGSGSYYSDAIPMLPYGTHEPIAFNEQGFAVGTCGTGSGLDPISVFPHGTQEIIPFITDATVDEDNNMPASLSYSPAVRSCVLPSFHVPTRKNRTHSLA